MTGIEKFDILIIEDDPPTIELLIDFFRIKGYSSHGARTGQKGMEILSKQIPKLILLDVILPDIDGYELCKKIKDLEHLKEIPIVYITARSEEEVLEKIDETGANGYLMKPFDMNEFDFLEKI